jgi:hypothetical protein
MSCLAKAVMDSSAVRMSENTQRMQLTHCAMRMSDFCTFVSEVDDNIGSVTETDQSVLTILSEIICTCLCRQTKFSTLADHAQQRNAEVGELKNKIVVWNRKESLGLVGGTILTATRMDQQLQTTLSLGLKIDQSQSWECLI